MKGSDFLLGRLCLIFLNTAEVTPDADLSASRPQGGGAGGFPKSSTYVTVTIHVMTNHVSSFCVFLMN